MFLFIAANSRENPGAESFQGAVEFLFSIADELNLSDEDWGYIYWYLKNVSSSDAAVEAIVNQLIEQREKEKQAEEEEEETDEEGDDDKGDDDDEETSNIRL